MRTLTYLVEKIMDTAMWVVRTVCPEIKEREEMSERIAVYFEKGA